MNSHIHAAGYVEEPMLAQSRGVIMVFIHVCAAGGPEELIVILEGESLFNGKPHHQPPGCVHPQYVVAASVMIKSRRQDLPALSMEYHMKDTNASD